MKVKLAASQLLGRALQWHQGFVKGRGPVAYDSWETYIQNMGPRFGAPVHDDPLADLRNLRQTGTVQDYIDAFDVIYPRVKIPEHHAISFFISGLFTTLQMPVRMFKPTSLAEAYSLARLQELTVEALHDPTKLTPTPLFFGTSTSINTSTNPITQKHNSPITSIPTSAGILPTPKTTTSKESSKSYVPPPKPLQAMTNQTLNEKRAKGLCFWCDEKFSPGH